MLGRYLDVVDRRIGITLVVIGALLMGGLAVTGLWVFLEHEPNPFYFDYRGNKPIVEPESSTAAAIHNALADATGLTLAATVVWIMFRVAYRIPILGLLALLLALFGILSGGFINFNAISRSGEISREEGYAQVFNGDLDFVITSRRETQPGVFQAMTAAHLLVLPAIAACVAAGLRWLGRAVRLER